MPIYSASELLIGAHMSISGGMEQAIMRGDSIGCGAIQLFTRSNRQWRSSTLTSDEIALFKETAAHARSVKIIIAHASYLINLASANSDIQERSTEALVDELKRCELLGIPYLVLHPGSGQSDSPNQILSIVAHNINKALQQAEGNTLLLLETTAGQGNSLGRSFEQLAYMYDNIKEKTRIGICVDTCHIFAAGYDISTKAGYMQTWQQFEYFLGYDLLHALHLNDSKKGVGSKVDRHEDIGKGKIGMEGFRQLLQDSHFKNKPKIIETPKEGMDDDKRNIATLISLL